MKITVPVAVVAALAVGPTVGVADAASTAKVAACNDKPAKRSACGSGGRSATRKADTVSKSWQIEAVSIEGTTTAKEDDPDYEFTMSGTTTIGTANGRGGKFQQPEKGIVTATLNGVTTKMTSTATWQDEQAGLYNCDLDWPAGSLPKSVTATGGPSRTFSDAIALRWNFVPSGWADCTQGDKRIVAPSPPQVGSDFLMTTYPASAFRKARRGTRRTLLVDLDQTATEGGVTVNQRWKGTVTLRCIATVA